MDEHIPDDDAARNLRALKDDNRKRRGDKIAKVLPYRALIEELRSEVPPRSWDEIAEALNKANIEISRAALARAFGAGERKRTGQRNTPTHIRALPGAATGTSGQQNTQHRPEEVEL